MPSCSPPTHLAVKDRQPWQCFFPQYSLHHVSHPTFVVNSATDFAALRLAFQPRSKGAFTDCVEYVASKGHQSHESLPNGCSNAYQRGVQMYSTYVKGNVTTLERARKSISSVILSQSRHCVAVYRNWTSIGTAGHRLPSAISNWYSDERKNFRLQKA